MKKEMAALLFYFYIESFSFSVSLSLLLLSSLHYMPMITLQKYKKAFFMFYFKVCMPVTQEILHIYIYINILLESCS